MSDETPSPEAPPALNGVKSAAITTAQVVRNPMAFLDWRAWGLGLWSNSVTPFALSFSTWLSTNGAEGAFHDVKFLHLDTFTQGTGISVKAAILQALTLSIVGAMRYISKTQGLPPGISATPFSLKSNPDEKQNPPAP